MTGVERLRLERLSVRLGERWAVTDVSLVVRAGEFVALTGPNGSGKTTLLRSAIGQLPPTRGSVRLSGSPPGALSIRQRARAVAWVPQTELPRDNIPLEEYLLFGRYAHIPPHAREARADRARVAQALSEVGLADRARSGVLELSGGERQRALLARALVQEAPLLLLDEPTAHLDIGHELDLLQRVRELVTDRGGAALAALHDLNLAARFADRVVVLSHGRLVEDGPPEAVLSEALLKEVWGVSAELKRDPRDGHRFLVPRLPDLPRRKEPPSGRGPVHVVGGGGAASPLLRGLAEAGYRVTAGALHMLDSDAQTAEELGVVFAAEAPFAPIGETARGENRRLLGAARAVVLTPFAVGPFNLCNLEDVLPLLGRVPVLLLGGPPGAAGPREGRDFTNGSASALWARLVAGGARELPSIAAVLAALDEALPPAAGPSAPTALRPLP